MRTTHTYATCNIVIDAVTGEIYVEDFSVETSDAENENPFFGRVARFLNGQHVRTFGGRGKRPFGYMRDFTEWLHEVGAIVDECRILGPTLSDDERKA